MVDCASEKSSDGYSIVGTGGRRVEKKTGTERGKSIAWRTVPLLAGTGRSAKGALYPPTHFSTFHVRPLCRPRCTPPQAHLKTTPLRSRPSSKILISSTSIFYGVLWLSRRL